MVRPFRPNSKVKVLAGDLQSEMVLPGIGDTSKVLYVTRVERNWGTNRATIFVTVNPHNPLDESSKIVINIDADFELIRYEMIENGL